MGRQAPPKLTNVQEEVRRLLKADFYYESKHARVRMRQRGVTESQVRYILENGLRDPDRDEFDWDYEAWKYVICGRTPAEDKAIRVVFTISKVPPLPNQYAVVITVILV